MLDSTRKSRIREDKFFSLPMDELQKRHRLEQRDLQSKITQKKKSATKKARKAVNDECAELERQLKERQASDLQELDTTSVTNGDGTLDAVHPADGDITDNDINLQDTQADGVVTALAEVKIVSQDQGRKPNRQKARLARRAAENEAIAAEAAEEVANIPDLRKQERLAMLKEFKARGLEEKDIRSDGHCLYAAVADQLTHHKIKVLHDSTTVGEPAYRIVRRVAAHYISDHSDDFLPFLEEPLDEYVIKVRDTGEWGGQLELQALATAYGIRINVLQGDGRVEMIGDDQQAVEKVIWLAYYRHSFGLGEHYNSLRHVSSSSAAV